MKAAFSKSALFSFARGMQLMASFRNLILVSSWSLRPCLFCIFFFFYLFSKSNRGYFLHGNLFFLHNPKMIQMLSILGEKLGSRKKKKQCIFSYGILSKDCLAPLENLRQKRKNKYYNLEGDRMAKWLARSILNGMRRFLVHKYFFCFNCVCHNRRLLQICFQNG